MDRETLLAAVRARAPWRSVANPMLKLVGAHPGLGWTDTLSNLLGKPGLTPVQTLELHAALTEHLIAGEKSLRLFRLSKAQKKELLKKGAASKAKPSDLVSAFPGTVNAHIAKQLGNVPPKFCAQYEEDDDESVSLLFTGARSYLERVELSADALKASVTGSADFESVFGVRRRHLQVYDAIWIPEGSEIVCVAVDYPHGAPKDFIASSHRSLEKVLLKAVGEIEPVNLWPAVEGLYESNEGSIVELGFTTDDDSVKTLKSRRGGKCLRQDIYHNAGSIKVGDSLTPYKLTVRWRVEHDREVITRPELSLPGTARLLFGGTATLYDAVLRHSLNLRDLNLAVSKLIDHV